MAISTLQENTYELVIREVPMSNIEKSTSGIIDVWPFDTVIITLDPDSFNESVSKGGLILKLPDNQLKLELVEQVIDEDQRKIKIINDYGIFILRGPEFHVYRGKVSGMENSSVHLTIHKNLLLGTIDIDGNPYHIVPTMKSRDGKTVLAVYRQDSVIVHENVNAYL